MSGKRTGLIFLTLVVMAMASASGPQEAGAIPSHTTCDFCHGVHGAVGTGFGGYLLDAATAEAVCMSCHGPGGISTLKADVHLNDTNSSYPVFRITCIQCHDSHAYQPNWLGGTNRKTVGVDISNGTDTFARINSPNSGIREVVFESRGDGAGDPTLHSFADGDQDGNGYYDGVCETCHTLTKFHRNNTSGTHTHNTGDTCIRCHGHAANFIK